MTDPIADFFIRIKNATLAGHAQVVVPHSKMKEAIANVLVKEGYLKSVNRSENLNHQPLVLEIAYSGRKPMITQIKLLSKPGRRLYAGVADLPKTLGGYGITIVTTNQGVMTDKQARKINVGGELLCQIW